MIISPETLNTEIKFTDHMKLKNKEGQSVNTSVLLRRGNKMLMGEITQSQKEHT